MKISLIKAAFLFSFAAFVLVTEKAYPQSDNNNSAIQDTLSKLSSVIWKQKTDSMRLVANDAFFRQFQTVLESKSSVSLALDSIKGITLAVSDDKKIRIFSWNIPLNNGSNEYYGFAQFISDSTTLIPLKSTKSEKGNFTQAQLTHQMWYGAIYYKIIMGQVAGKQVYTLLGWDGYSQTSNRKIIDILSVSDNGDFIFGLPVFKTDKGITSRVVFEYAERANMLMRYDYQSIMVQKRKRVVKENVWLIVLDRLIPMDPSMDGMRKYYVPAGDTYDGYMFKNGYWVLVEDIEVANSPTAR
ncbi:MAG: hypothetical protein ACOYN4_07310 [Bacteroidales bacterium]